MAFLGFYSKVANLKLCLSYSNVFFKICVSFSPVVFLTKLYRILHLVWTVKGLFKNLKGCLHRFGGFPFFFYVCSFLLTRFPPSISSCFSSPKHLHLHLARLYFRFEIFLLYICSFDCSASWGKLCECGSHLVFCFFFLSVVESSSISSSFWSLAFK